MKFGRMLVLSLATLLIAAPAVYAQDDDMGDLTTKKPTRRQVIEEESNDPARSGPILGVGGIFALENFSGVGQSTDNSGGFNAHVGYRFNPRFSSDLHIERYQEFDAKNGEVNGWAVGLNGRGYLLTGKYQPFLLGGINYLDMETSNSAAPNPKKTDDGPALRFGTGLDWYVTSNLVLTGDISYMLALSQVEGYDMVIFSLGFFYRP
ncbi:MAG: outer membrane beta-barrel protein [Candidatus Binatia bacterium]